MSAPATVKAACRRTALPSCQGAPAAPSVAATKPRQKVDARASASGRSATPAAARSASAEKIACEACASSGSDASVAGLSTSSTTGMLRSRAARQMGSAKSGKWLSARTTPAPATSRAQSFGGGALEPLRAARGQEPLAGGIDENSRDRSRGAFDMLRAVDIDRVPDETVEHALTELVVADWPAEARPSAEPRNRGRGVGGVAAAGQEKLARHRLRARRRETVDAEHEIDHRHSHAQNEGSGGAGAGFDIRPGREPTREAGTLGIDSRSGIHGPTQLPRC